MSQERPNEEVVQDVLLQSPLLSMLLSQADDFLANNQEMVKL